MSNWDGSERRNDDFGHYKELILNEIKTLKLEFGEFRKDTNDKVSSLQVTLAVLNTKLMVASSLSSMVVGTIVAFVMNTMLGNK